MLSNRDNCIENYNYERKIFGFVVADCVFEIYVHQIDDLSSQMTILKTIIP